MFIYNIFCFSNIYSLFVPLKLFFLPFWFYSFSILNIYLPFWIYEWPKNDIFDFGNLFNICIIIWRYFHIYIYYLPLDIFSENQQNKCISLACKCKSLNWFLNRIWFYSFIVLNHYINISYSLKNNLHWKFFYANFF